jgi:hypothetical protein
MLEYIGMYQIINEQDAGRLNSFHSLEGKQIRVARPGTYQGNFGA